MVLLIIISYRSNDWLWFTWANSGWHSSPMGSYSLRVCAL